MPLRQNSDIRSVPGQLDLWHSNSLHCSSVFCSVFCSMKPKNKKDIRDKKELDSFEKSIFSDERQKRRMKKELKQHINRGKRRREKIELENLTEDATIWDEEDNHRDE